jgi:hypothetical protein
MTPWQQFKPLYRAEAATALVPRGFRNPGIAMWRRRDPLVDVVFARSKYGDDVTVWLGCGLRKMRPQPLPWVCIFQACAYHSLLPEPPTEQLAHSAMEAVASRAYAWFDTLADVLAARTVVESANKNFVMFAAGSPAQDEARTQLFVPR